MTTTARRVLPVDVPTHKEISKERFGGCVEIAVWGRHEGDFADIHEKPDQLEIIRGYARERGVKQIFAPVVTGCTTSITSNPVDFPLWITEGDPIVYHGAPADGVILGEGDALFLATGDCPTVVMRHPSSGKVVAFHAGRKSLIDEDFVRGQRDKPQESVVQNAAKNFMSGGRFKVSAGVFLSVGPRFFKHPANHAVHGEFNRRLIDHVCSTWGGQCFAQPIQTQGEGKEYRVLPRESSPRVCQEGELDLYALIQRQLARTGVSPGNVVHDGISTATSGCAIFDHLWWSHCRFVRNKETVDGRNGVLVMRLK